MFKCDQSNCKRQAHPFCLGEELRSSITKNSDSAVPWQILLRDYVSEDCKVIPSRESLGIIGFQGSNLVQECRKNIWKRGGFLTIFCDIHKQPEEYCICGITEDEDQEGFMICCESCENWYHGECVGISSQQGTQIKEYFCERCTKWQEKRENFIYSISHSKSSDIELLEKFEKGSSMLIPEAPFGFRLIDFIIIAEAWSRLADVLQNSSRNNSEITAHLRIIEKIPINCGSRVQTLIQKCQKTIISAEKFLPNFQDLQKHKPLEILTEDGRINTTNLNTNQTNLTILSEACKDLEPSQISACPDLKLLAKTIDCLKVLKGISEYYDPNFSGQKDLERYEKLFEALKATPYKGKLLTIMDQEIAEYNKFCQDAEYILREEAKKDTSAAASYNGITQQERVDCQVRDWKQAVNTKIDKSKFDKVLHNSSCLQIDCSKYLPELTRIDNLCNQYEDKLNQTILCVNKKLTITECEEIILQGIRMAIPPKKMLMKAINKYKKLATFAIICEDICNATPQNKQDSKNLHEILQYIDRTCYTNHCLLEPQLDKINKIHTECKQLQQKIKLFKSSKPTEIKAFIDEINSTTRVTLPGLQKLYQRMILCQIMDPEPASDPLDSTITEIEAILEDLSENKLKIPGKHKDDVDLEIREKIEFTNQMMKKQSQCQTSEAAEDLMKAVKASGVYVKPIHNLLNDTVLSLSWLESTSEDIRKMYETHFKKAAPKDILDNPDCLDFIANKKLKDYCKITEKVNKVMGPKPALLYKTLAKMQWTRECHKSIKSDLTEVPHTTLQRLLKLGTSLNLTSPEFHHLQESHQHLEILHKFSTGCDPHILDSLLLLQCPDLPSQLESLLSKTKSPSKISKITQILPLAKISKSLYSFTKDPNPSAHSAKILLAQARDQGLPSQNPYFSKLKSQLDQYDSLFPALTAKFPEQKCNIAQILNPASTTYTIERKLDLLNKANGLAIELRDQVKEVTNDIRKVKNLVVKAKKWAKQATKKETEGLYKEIRALYLDLERLPLTTTEDLEVLRRVATAHAIQEAKQYMVGKKRFEEWKVLYGKLQFEKEADEMETYEIFVEIYKTAAKLNKFFQKINPDPYFIPKMLSEASQSPINFETEVESLKTNYQRYLEIKKKLQDSYKENISIEDLQKDHCMLSESSFGFTQEIRHFKKLLNMCKSMKKRMLKIMTLKTSKRITSEKANKEVKEYIDLGVKFQEGDKFKHWVEQSDQQYQQVSNEVTTFSQLNKALDYDQYVALEAKLTHLPFDYSKTNPALKSHLRNLFQNCVVGCFKNYSNHQIAYCKPQPNKDPKDDLNKLICKPISSFKNEENDSKAPFLPACKKVPLPRLEAFLSHSADSASRQPACALKEIEEYVKQVLAQIDCIKTHEALKNLAEDLQLHSFVNFEEAVATKKKTLKKMPKRERNPSPKKKVAKQRPKQSPMQRPKQSPKQPRKKREQKERAKQADEEQKLEKKVETKKNLKNTMERLKQKLGPKESKADMMPKLCRNDKLRKRDSSSSSSSSESSSSSSSSSTSTNSTQNSPNLAQQKPASTLKPVNPTKNTPKQLSKASKTFSKSFGSELKFSKQAKDSGSNEDTKSTSGELTPKSSQKPVKPLLGKSLKFKRVQNNGLKRKIKSSLADSLKRLKNCVKIRFKVCLGGFEGGIWVCFCIWNKSRYFRFLRDMFELNFKDRYFWIFEIYVCGVMSRCYFICLKNSCRALINKKKKICAVEIRKRILEDQDIHHKSSSNSSQNQRANNKSNSKIQKQQKTKYSQRKKTAGFKKKTEFTKDEKLLIQVLKYTNKSSGSVQTLYAPLNIAAEELPKSSKKDSKVMETAKNAVVNITDEAPTHQNSEQINLPPEKKSIKRLKIEGIFLKTIKKYLVTKEEGINPNQFADRIERCLYKKCQQKIASQYWKHAEVVNSNLQALSDYLPSLRLISKGKFDTEEMMLSRIAFRRKSMQRKINLQEKLQHKMLIQQKNEEIKRREQEEMNRPHNPKQTLKKIIQSAVDYRPKCTNSMRSRLAQLVPQNDRNDEAQDKDLEHRLNREERQLNEAIKRSLIDLKKKKAQSS
ncbi:unnamed protein product [Moneuplotes crassus]|uniref:PHD-type domain-containing protein n=1 Tax=Euplotes crassus TaxID=5936 RepID=A0AAD1Y075_EUPCR|nr:unnamed protein product [Moneuplotes crassus]